METNNLDLNNNLQSKDSINQNQYLINVLIKEKTFKIFSGSGNQKVRWLTDAAILKYETIYRNCCGLAFGVKLENGQTCDLDKKINEVLKPNENVWVLLREEYTAFKDDDEN